MWRRSLWLALIEITAALLGAVEVRGEVAKPDPEVSTILMKVTEQEINSLPTPSTIGYIGRPDYARTEARCAGEESVQAYLAKQLPWETSIKVQSYSPVYFVSASIVPDAQPIEGFVLTDEQRLTVRSYLRAALRGRADQKEVRDNLLFAIGFPATATPVGWVAWFAGAGAIAVDAYTKRYSELLAAMADSLWHSTTAFRSVATIGDRDGRNYLRVDYALHVAHDKVTYIFRRCYFAMKPLAQ